MPSVATWCDSRTERSVRPLSGMQLAFHCDARFSVRPHSGQSGEPRPCTVSPCRCPKVLESRATSTPAMHPCRTSDHVFQHRVKQWPFPHTHARPRAPSDAHTQTPSSHALAYSLAHTLTRARTRTGMHSRGSIPPTLACTPDPHSHREAQRARLLFTAYYLSPGALNGVAVPRFVARAKGADTPVPVRLARPSDFPGHGDHRQAAVP